MTPSARLLLGLVGALIAFALLLVPRSAGAAQTCEERARAWLAECPDAEGHCIEPFLCPPGLILFHAGCATDAFDIEIGPASGSSFRNVGALGVAPVGSYPSWAAEPEGRRAAFDAVLACAKRDDTLLSPPGTEPSPASAAGDGSGDSGRARTIAARVGMPWRLLLGLAALVVLVFVRTSNSSTTRLVADKREGLALLVLFGITLGTRLLALGLGFFHENGQGPLFIATALDPGGDASHYGPGYWELYSALATWATRPEYVLFGLHAILGATVPVCAWLTARAVDAPTPVAWGLAGLVAATPVLGWVFASESYYATWIWILGVATLSLALGSNSLPDASEAGRYTRGRATLEFALAIASAGLLVAQAARVIPVGWIPAALLPLVVVVGPGSTRARLLAATVAGVGIAVIVALCSGPVMLAVIDGYLGREWMPQAGGSSTRVSWELVVVALTCLTTVGLLARFAGQSQRLILPGLALLLLVLSFERTAAILGGHTPATLQAYLALGIPVAVPVFAALLRELEARPRGFALGILVALGLGVHMVAGLAARPSTDALELRWFLGLRERLPLDAKIVYVGQGDKLVLHLPIYPRAPGHTRQEMVLRGGRPPAHVEPGEAPLFWVRTSLCASPEGAGTCAEFEDTHLLEPLATTELPARCYDCVYFDDPITVGVYRVRGPK